MQSNGTQQCQVYYKTKLTWLNDFNRFKVKFGFVRPISGLSNKNLSREDVQTLEKVVA